MTHLVSQHTLGANRGQDKVMGQEVKSPGVYMVLHTQQARCMIVLLQLLWRCFSNCFSAAEEQLPGQRLPPEREASRSPASQLCPQGTANFSQWRRVACSSTAMASRSG